jgi:hypothetical protein
VVSSERAKALASPLAKMPRRTAARIRRREMEIWRPDMGRGVRTRQLDTDGGFQLTDQEVAEAFCQIHMGVGVIEDITAVMKLVPKVPVRSQKSNEAGGLDGQTRNEDIHALPSLVWLSTLVLFSGMECLVPLWNPRPLKQTLSQ